jgi:hypothetical protein
VIAGDDPSQILGIELNREGSLAHKVAEHHRELTTPGAVMQGRRRRGLRHGLACGLTSIPLPRPVLVMRLAGDSRRRGAVRSGG